MSRRFIADALTEAKIATWKAAHIAVERTKITVATAREAVRIVFAERDADIIESSLGAFTLQHRSGGKSIDWEAIATEGVPKSKLAKLIAKHTTTSAAPAPVLAAPPAWGLEAKTNERQ